MPPRDANPTPSFGGFGLSGGSAFGLDAASGVMRYLEEKDIGYGVGRVKVPIVPAAILFDLGVVTDKVRPGPEQGYLAYRNAGDGRLKEGSVGAGTGATVAKVLGWERAVKGGLGTAALDLGEGLVVGAVVAVNALGGIFDNDAGSIVAGPRAEEGGTMLDALEALTSTHTSRPAENPIGNTTIGVVATNARLTKEQANKLASVAHDGLAIAVRPAHTMRDGDTMFALASGLLDQPPDMYRLGAATVLCVSRAIVRGVRMAKGLGGVPSVAELTFGGAD